MLVNTLRKQQHWNQRIVEEHVWTQNYNTEIHGQMNLAFFFGNCAVQKSIPNTMESKYICNIPYIT
jgi:hypothetical protein